MTPSLTHRMTITRIKTSLLTTTPSGRLRKIEGAISERLAGGNATASTLDQQEDLCWIQRELQNRKTS